MSRIMIIGGPGSGKSTLARALGRRLDLPVVHGDRFFFREGWVQRPSDETRDLFDAAAAADRWIIDGNHSRSWTTRAARADLIVFLDFPQRVLLWRVVARILRYYGRVRPDMAAGCPERFNWAFLVWAWNYRRDTRPKALALVEAWRERVPVAHLSSRREVEGFLAEADALERGA